MNTTQDHVIHLPWIGGGGDLISLFIVDNFSNAFLWSHIASLFFFFLSQVNLISVLVHVLCFTFPFQNGDYNKPIPAQYMEHLNHGVSAGLTQAEVPRPLQWVNCQMLLCKKCNQNQTLKIKQLASFLPRDEVCATTPRICLWMLCTLHAPVFLGFVCLFSG